MIVDSNSSSSSSSRYCTFGMVNSSSDLVLFISFREHLNLFS